MDQVQLTYGLFETKYKFPKVNVTKPVDPLFRASVTSINSSINGPDMKNGLVSWQQQLPSNSSGILDQSGITPLYMLVRDVKIQAALKRATVDYGSGVLCR